MKISEKLTCPSCTALDKVNHPVMKESGQNTGLCCSRCMKTYPINYGIIDFVDKEIRDISISQRVMEFSPIVAIYEHVWRPLVTKPFSDLSWEMETVTRLLNLMPHHDLLDIACGTGNFTRLFLNSIRNGTVTGIDLSPSMLMKGAKKLGVSYRDDLTLLRVDVTRWPFVPECFDRIHCAGALHLFPQIQSVFHSIACSLKPEGVFVGATYIKDKGPVKSAIQKWISFRSGFHWFEPEELFELAYNAGFVEWEQHIHKQGFIFRVKKR